MSHISGMIRVMSAVPRVHLADPQANVREIVELLRQADAQNVRLCVFPELCLCGYTCADLLIHPPLLSGCLQALDTLLQAPVRAAFVVGLPLEIGGRLYNCAVAVCGGRILGVVPENASAGQLRILREALVRAGAFRAGKHDALRADRPCRRGSGFRLRAVLLRRRALRRSVGARSRRRPNSAWAAR